MKNIIQEIDWKRVLINVFIATGIYSVLLWIFSLLSGIEEVFAGITLLVVGVLLVWALKVHPGKEEFFSVFTQTIFVVALSTMIFTYIGIVEPMNVMSILQGLGLAFAAVLLGDTVIDKYFGKYV